MTTYDADEAAARAGIDIELATRFWIALGFPGAQPGDPIFTDDDVDALRFVGDLIRSGTVDERLALQMTRTIASSMARIADAQVEIAVDRMRRGETVGTDGEGELALDASVVERMPWVLGYVWRKHAQASWRRAVETGGDHAALTVGFADLVGFTALSQEVSSEELASVVDRFTSLAFSTVVSLGGRVIKTIGDEVMFAVETPAAGVEIGLTLAEAHREDDELSDVRVGLATGEVLDHDGDLFGPPVNLASRLTAIARPGSVVVGPDVHEALADDPALAWRTLRPRNLKGIGRVPLWRVRRA